MTTATKTTEPKTIAKIRRILEGHTAAKIDGVLVDAFSASAIAAVYDALNDENRAKYAALPIGRMAEIAWKVAK